MNLLNSFWVGSLLVTYLLFPTIHQTLQDCDFVFLGPLDGIDLSLDSFAEDTDKNIRWEGGRMSALVECQRRRGVWVHVLEFGLHLVL